jgi:hypothetical protein
VAISKSGKLSERAREKCPGSGCNQPDCGGFYASRLSPQ